MSSDSGSNRKQTLDQRRACDAWERVNAVSHLPERKRCEEYTGEAHKLPVRIMASGLGQALAFLFAKQKKKPGLEQLLTDLSRWVLVERHLSEPAAVKEPGKPAVERIRISAIPIAPQKSPDLLQAVIQNDTEFLRWATDETLAYLQWVNRFAEGLGHDPAIDSGS